MMRRLFDQFQIGAIVGVALVAGCVILLLIVAGSGKGANTDPSVVESAERENERPAEDFLPILESIRDVYASIDSLSFEGHADIRVFSGTSQINGNASLVYAAQSNRYRYETTVAEVLQQVGLMRDVETLFDGTKYYFFDKESRIVSFQASEEVRLPNALPNPFFLQLDFLSNDDDQCVNCKMRLHDVKQPLRWPKRASSLSIVSSLIDDGVRDVVLEMDGGKVDDIEYKFRVRLTGTESDLRITNVARLRSDGTILAEVVFNDFRPVQNFTRVIPHEIVVAARKPDGSIALTATYQLSNFRVNEASIADSFAPTFEGAEKYWDSDSKSFVSN